MNKITFPNPNEFTAFHVDNCGRCAHMGKCLNQKYLIAGTPEELPDHVLYRHAEITRCLLFEKAKKIQPEKYKKLRGS